ncbi:hypothetical protein [Malikia spinosa]|jgi:hypothetical protein|uniref:hypothetical protein n=1 Tax=Malikia spinosa TaxID=86180 RepID=UPI0011B03B93|nr:hypothetical protein [Malikia spinosa]
MSYLVRKIERSRWNGSDVATGRIKADVVASCIRPNGSELSVWFAENDNEIEQAKLAMLAAMNKLATVDLVILPITEIQEAGLKVATTLPKSGPESLRPLHRDIHDLDLDSLKVIAQIIQRHIMEKKSERLTREACKKILQGAIHKNLLSATELHEDIAKHMAAA